MISFNRSVIFWAFSFVILVKNKGKLLERICILEFCIISFVAKFFPNLSKTSFSSSNSSFRISCLYLLRVWDLLPPPPIKSEFD